MGQENGTSNRDTTSGYVFVSFNRLYAFFFVSNGRVPFSCHVLGACFFAVDVVVVGRCFGALTCRESESTTKVES